MAEIKWGAAGQRRYETGVDRGALYVRDPETGDYPDGVAWVGLTTVTESPSGAESNKQYADNRVYVNLRSKEEFAGTIEAFTYPEEFEICEGSREVAQGVLATQQNRLPFGLSYRNLMGNDTKGLDLGYKLHLVWGATAAPSEKARGTINDSPEAATFSWEFDTDPMEVTAVEGISATAHFVIDSTRTDPAKLKALEDVLYGRGTNTTAKLPTPDEVIDLVGPLDGAAVSSVSTFSSAAFVPDANES